MTKAAFVLMLVMAAATLSCATAKVVDHTKLKPLMERSLKLRLEIAKREYLELEPIFITFWVENIGTTPEYFRFAEIQQLAVRDQSGSLVKYRGPIVDYVTEALKVDTGYIQSYTDWVEVAPRCSSTGIVMCLLDFYGTGNRWANLRLPAGTYTIAGNGIRTDTIRIRIVSPSKPEEIRAFRLMGETLDIPAHGAANRLYTAFAEFVREYPHSAYAPIAQRELLLASSFIEDASASNTQSLALDLLEKYPSTGFVWEALVELNTASLNVQQRKSVADRLKVVLETFPNTQYEQLARKLLDKL